MAVYDLLIITCSKAKDEDPEPIPIMCRYDGPKFRTLRSELRKYWYPKKPDVLESVPEWLHILCLSGWYGLLPYWDTSVPNYDSKGVMRPGLQAHFITKLVEHREEHGCPEHVLCIGNYPLYGISEDTMGKLKLLFKTNEVHWPRVPPGKQCQEIIQWLAERWLEHE